MHDEQVARCGGADERQVDVLDTVGCPYAGSGARDALDLGETALIEHVTHTGASHSASGWSSPRCSRQTRVSSHSRW